ncbi:MAG: DUF1444 family protein [Phycisphaera sp.]|nr:DUF1444 family protein [Phycisphaera sp.]
MDLPREPEAFTEIVHRHFLRRASGHRLDITGPLEVAVDKRAVDLRDLFRAMLTCDIDVDDVAVMIDRFVEGQLDAMRFEELTLSFDVVAPRVMPRIYPMDDFQRRRTGHVAYQPFIHDTVILYVIDLTTGAETAVTIEQMIRWGVDIEELDTIARQNLKMREPTLNVELYVQDDERTAVLNVGDGYDASRLLLTPVYKALAPELGGNFLVAIPTRDRFIAFPRTHDDLIHRLRPHIASDYRKLPYPITDHLFLVTLDGIADWGEAA